MLKIKSQYFIFISICADSSIISYIYVNYNYKFSNLITEKIVKKLFNESER